MLVWLLILISFTNAVTIRRDKSVLFSRTVIIGLLLTSFIAYTNFHINPLGKGIGLYGGLFNVSSFTMIFNIFILLISAIILILTTFFPQSTPSVILLKMYNMLSKDILHKFFKFSINFLSYFTILCITGQTDTQLFFIVYIIIKYFNTLIIIVMEHIKGGKLQIDKLMLQTSVSKILIIFCFLFCEDFGYFGYLLLCFLLYITENENVGNICLLGLNYSEMFGFTEAKKNFFKNFRNNPEFRNLSRNQILREINQARRHSSNLLSMLEREVEGSPNYCKKEYKLIQNEIKRTKLYQAISDMPLDGARERNFDQDEVQAFVKKQLEKQNN